MIPDGILADRLILINRAAPELFSGDSFLDIGSNKGFFSLHAAKSCKKVLAVENDDTCVELCQDLGIETVREIPGSGLFDRIFIGNAHHYLYRDYGGWGWVRDIAELSTGLLVIEGPSGMDCADMQAAIPDDLREGFSKEEFLHHLGLHFSLVSTSRTVNYTPDRYIFVFRRRDRLTSCDMETFSKYLTTVYERMSKKIKPADTVVEVCCRHDRGVISKAMFDCEKFIKVDLNEKRADKAIDVLKRPTPKCDVLISTAILHHRTQEQWPNILGNLTKNTKRLIVLTGPSELLPLFGDHESHLDVPLITWCMANLGWHLIDSRSIGLSEPYGELYLEYGRDT